MSRKSVRNTLRKVANRQTNNDDYISSLVEIITIQQMSIKTETCIKAFKYLNGKMISRVTKNVMAKTANTKSHSLLYLQYLASLANCSKTIQLPLSIDNWHQ